MSSTSLFVVPQGKLLHFALNAFMSIGFITGHMQGIVGLVFILAFITFFAACIGPVFWILMAEIFPARSRGVGRSVAVFVQWFSDFLVVFLFPWLLRHLRGTGEKTSQLPGVNTPGL